MSQLDGITDSMDMNLGKLKEGEGQESPGCYSPWDGEESDTTQSLNSNKAMIKSHLSDLMWQNQLYTLSI